MRRPRDLAQTSEVRMGPGTSEVWTAAVFGMIKTPIDVRGAQGLEPFLKAKAPWQAKAGSPL